MEFWNEIICWYCNNKLKVYYNYKNPLGPSYAFCCCHRVHKRYFIAFPYNTECVLDVQFYFPYNKLIINIYTNVNDGRSYYNINYRTGAFYLDDYFLLSYSPKESVNIVKRLIKYKMFS